jgi:hypothetical protein
VAGATAVAGRGSALPDRHGPLRIEVEEVTEEYIAVMVSISEELYERATERGAFPERVFLGLADRFVIREDRVSLPENAEVLARPVEMDFENPHDVAMYFRTRDIDFSEVEGEEVTLGLGIFTEHAVDNTTWDTARFVHDGDFV